MKLKIITSITLLLIILSSNVFSQDLTKETHDEKLVELRKKVSVLLRETSAEIETLRSIENRITFRTEAAELMWKIDEEEGERMFVQVADDFINLLSRHNANLNALGGIKSDREMYSSRGSNKQKFKIIVRLRAAREVRQKIALSIAKYDSQLAYDFIVRTSEIVTDETFKNSFRHSDASIISNIIRAVSTDDIDKAIAFGRLSLKKNFTIAHMELLDRIYKKDKDKAIEFGEEIIAKVQSQIKEPKSNLQYASYILKSGSKYIEKSKNNPSDREIFDRNSLKDLAEQLADRVIARKSDVPHYQIGGYYHQIRKFSPNAAKRMKAKYKDVPDGVVGDAMKAGAGFIVPPVPTAAVKLTPKQQANRDLMKKKNKLLEDLNKPNAVKKISDEEKAKFIREAQTIISKIDDSMEKMFAIIGLAVRVKQLGDAELASELMDEAQVLVNPQPQNYQDFLQSWMLAGGYSRLDADKAFPILEDTIFRLNETIEAFVKVGEFMDLAGEIVRDNEVQLGSFSGSLVNGLLSSLQNPDRVFAKLSAADFDRTKSLADRFNRSEVRVLAKLLILKSILKNKEPSEKSESVDAAGVK